MLRMVVADRQERLPDTCVRGNICVRVSHKTNTSTAALSP